MDLRINKVYNLIRPQDNNIYEEAHNYYLRNPVTKEQIEIIVSSVLRQSIPTQDILDALFFVGVLPNSRKTYFLGYLFYAVPLPPFWYTTYDINKNKIYYNYKMVYKNLELPPFYQYLEYLKHYYDDVEDEIEVDIPYQTLDDEYLIFYQYKENEYNTNPLTKYKRLAFSYLKNRVNKTTAFKIGKIREKEFESINNDVDSYITKTRINKYKNQKDVEMINSKIQSLIQRNKRVSSAITAYNKTQTQLHGIKEKNRKLTGKAVESVFDELEEEMKNEINTKRLQAEEFKNTPQQSKNNFMNCGLNVGKTKQNYEIPKQKNVGNILTIVPGSNRNFNRGISNYKLPVPIGSTINHHITNNSFIEPALTIANNEDKLRLRPLTAFQISKPTTKPQSAVAKPIFITQSKANFNNTGKENVDVNTTKPSNANKRSILERSVSEFVLKKNVKSQYGNRLIRCKSVLDTEKEKVGELQRYFSNNKIELNETKLNKALTVPNVLSPDGKPKLLARSGSTLIKFLVPKKVRRKRKKAN